MSQNKNILHMLPRVFLRALSLQRPKYWLLIHPVTGCQSCNRPCTAPNPQSQLASGIQSHITSLCSEPNLRLRLGLASSRRCMRWKDVRIAGFKSLSTFQQASSSGWLSKFYRGTEHPRRGIFQNREPGKWFSPTICFCKGRSVVNHRAAPSRVKNLQPLRGTGSVAITIIFLLRTFQVSQNP